MRVIGVILCTFLKYSMLLAVVYYMTNKPDELSDFDSIGLTACASLFSFLAFTLKQDL